MWLPLTEPEGGPNNKYCLVRSPVSSGHVGVGEEAATSTITHCQGGGTVTQ